jgi:hypothetical protein
VGDDRGQRIAAGGTVGERLTDDHRPVDELLVGRDQRHVGVLRCEIGQGEGRLEPGDSAADDQDSELLGSEAGWSSGVGVAWHGH